jgi:small subunit ribosomal protein S21
VSERNGGAGSTIQVVDNQIDKALKVLKKQMQRDGLFSEMKRRASYEKPSEKRKRKQARARKRERKARARTALRSNNDE